MATLGEIRKFVRLPQGWAPCNGALLRIGEHQALFSVLKTKYGGDGRTTFALPKMEANDYICIEGDYPQPGEEPPEDEPTLGEMRKLSGPRKGWLPCDGSLLEIRKHQALFSIVGATHGGDGKTTFALPKMAAGYHISVVGIYPR